MATDPSMPETLGGSTTEPRPADSEPDASLLAQMIRGSEEALAILYDRHVGAVFASAMRVSRDSWVAAEVVQETFLALWNRGELFDPGRGELPAWLRTIARNRAVDHLRAAGRHERATTFSSFAQAATDDGSIAEWLSTTGNLVSVAAPELSPETALSSKETRASVDEAVASLNPIERSVIMLAYEGGLSQSEIATRLGWPIGTVKTRTRRALRHLRDRLERPGAGVAADTTGPQRDARENTRSTHIKRPAVGLGECLAPC